MNKTSRPISTRFSEEQKSWVEKAAQLKGCSPAKFVRMAATEKAVHVLNTSHPNTFDFESTAREVAGQLCEPIVEVFDENGRPVPDDPDFIEPYSYVAARISSAKLRIVREAVRLGGVEFIVAVLEQCATLIEPPERVKLPPPIQPK